jgi:hypothetical protein
MSAAVELMMLTRADRAGTWLSLLCAAHCMASPLLVTILPLAGLGLLVQEATEGVLLAASVALAAASLCWGFRLHRRWRVLLFLVGALGFIVAGRWMANGASERTLVVIGAGMLTAGHLLNRYLCSVCVVCPHGENDRHS